MLITLLSAALLFPSPSGMGRGVHPAAWACGSVQLPDAPAGLSRLTGPEAGAWFWGDGNGSGAVGLAGGLPLAESGFAGGVSAYAGKDFSRYGAVAGGSWVVTGDPIGFMEGLFGPSLVLGASGGVLEEGDGAFPVGTVSAQLSLFPSFALGASCLWKHDGRPEGDFGFTHVFNRAFTLNAGLSGSDPEIGAVLTVSPGLSVSAGTGGSLWHTGVSVKTGSWRVEGAVAASREELSGGAGVSWSTGW
jgi:hypothetical protein